MRTTLGHCARRLCEWISRLFFERQIFDRDGVSLYLSRFYVVGSPRDSGLAFDSRGVPLPTARWSRLPVNVFLHKFHRGDDARELHNHPWRWAFSLVLAGGYIEERWHPSRPNHCIHVRSFRPFSVNVLRADDFHRVDLIERDCWSIFVAGPRMQSWGFWSRDIGEFTPWREFLGLPPAA